MRRIYGLSFLVFCLIPQVHALPNFVHQAIYFGSDLWKLCKPEWRTRKRHEPVYKKSNDGDDGYYQLAYRVVEKEGKLVAERITMGDLLTFIYDKSEKKESLEEIKVSVQKSMDESTIKDAEGEVLYYRYTYKPFPNDQAKKGEERTIYVKADLNEELFILNESYELYEVKNPDNFLECTGLDEWKRPTYAMVSAEKLLERIRAIFHEEQTQEKVGTMHYLKSAYSVKRNTKLLGCYVFMKPYALACVAGLTIGTHRLLKKLGVYELMKPSAQGLEPDELDGK